jgi:hypothetical protein
MGGELRQIRLLKDGGPLEVVYGFSHSNTCSLIFYSSCEYAIQPNREMGAIEAALAHSWRSIVAKSHLLSGFNITDLIKR